MLIVYNDMQCSSVGYLKKISDTCSAPLYTDEVEWMMMGSQLTLRGLYFMH